MSVTCQIGDDRFLWDCDKEMRDVEVQPSLLSDEGMLHGE